MVKNLPTVERSTKIRFGKHALEDQAENTIVFNASNTEMQATKPGAVYLSPIRFREDFSDSQIVLLMYDKTTGEITESGSSASTAIEPELSYVTSFGNTTPHTIQFTNPTTAFTAAGNVHINGDLASVGGAFTGDVSGVAGTFTGDVSGASITDGTGTLSGGAWSGSAATLTTARTIGGVSFDGSQDIVPTTFGTISATDGTFTGNVSAGGTGIFSGDVSGVKGTFTGDVSGVKGTFTGDVSGAAGTFNSDVHIYGDLDIQGNVQFRNGTITEIKNTDLVVEDRIIGIAHNNTQTGLDTGIIINYPNQNVGIIHHGDENPKRLSIGYTQNSSTDTAITADSNNITLDVLGDLKVQNDAQIIGALSTTTITASGVVSGVAGTFIGNVSAGGTGIFSGDVSGAAGIFTGAVSGTSITDGTGTLSGGVWSGSAATLTTPRTIGGVSFNGSQNIDLPGVNEAGNQDTTGSAATLTTAINIGGVSFNGSQDIVPTTFNAISATDGTFTGNVSAVGTGTFTGAVTGAGYSGGAIQGTTGTFSSTLSSAGFNAASANIDGNLTVNTNALFVNATDKKVGIGKTPTANLDILGNISSSTGITSAAGGITATTGLFTGDGGGLTNIQVSSLASDVILGTHTSGDYVASLVGGDGITVGAAAESATPTIAVDLKTNGGLVIESNQVALKLDASSITGTLAVTDGGTGVTTSTGSSNVVLSDSPTLTGTLTGEIADFSGVLTVSDGTSAVSTTTAALVVSGGIGAVGNVYSGDLYASAGLDHCSYIGTSKIGFDGTNTGHAAFAHSGNMTGTAYAIKQDSAGATKLNAKTGQGISLGINNVEKVVVTSGGDFRVNTNTLCVDASEARVGIGTDAPAANRELDVVGNVYASQNITAAVSLNAGRVTVTDGLIINAGSVTKKFYSYSGTIAHNTDLTAAGDGIKLTFSSRIFYAKIVAHLVEDTVEFSNMSLEVGGGSRAGGSSPNLKLGSVSVFGNTSTNPWNSTPDVSTTAGAIIIKPSSIINDGGAASGTPDALYNLFIEYITPDATNGKLLTIHQGTTAVKTFNY